MTYFIELGRPSDLSEAVAIDDDACTLFESVGITVSGAAFEAYTRVEQALWLRAAGLGRLFFGCDERGARLGLLVLDRFDGGTYIEQLSVRRSAMQRGLGRFLLAHANAWARENHDPVLWLTTYGHVAWNRPFYESAGFSAINARECGEGVRAQLAEQRAVLPAPEQRVAMRKSLARAADG